MDRNIGSPTRQVFNALGDQTTTEGSQETYQQKLFQLIPAEIVALYLTLEAIYLSSRTDLSTIVYWGLFVFCLALCPVYLSKLQSVVNRRQLVFSTGAFVVWIITLGGPFEFTFADSWTATYGALLLPMYTALTPLFVEPK